MNRSVLLALGAASLLAGCAETSATAKESPKNVVFFLGDGMGMTTLTAARIYKVGEDGELTIDTLPETGFVKTFSNDTQVTDSAPSMSAYMTGVKMNNDVISMSTETAAFSATGVNYLSGADSTCPATNGKPVTTLLELAKAAGRGTGVVTTTRMTHATPAATYAHICHRDAENTIAAQMVPGGAGYNLALGGGIDVVLGGGRRHYVPSTTAGSKRTDARDLLAEMFAQGYTVAATRAEMNAADPGRRLLGLFTMDHMAYDLDRVPANEPSLAEMTGKAIDLLKNNGKGFFLMVEGGRIDHALHSTNARRALQDTVAFDDAIQAAIDRLQVIDPGLKNTLIVVTADHDHTMVLNGYAKRTGPTTATSPGVLGLVKNILTGANVTDTGANPFTIIGFGNGESRPATRTALTDAQVANVDYHQEAVIPMPAGGETHGGTDVFIGATGLGAPSFTGIIENVEVFGLVRKAAGL
jgi:alkaline phosphatase